MSGQHVYILLEVSCLEDYDHSCTASVENVFATFDLARAEVQRLADEYVREAADEKNWRSAAWYRARGREPKPPTEPTFMTVEWEQCANEQDTWMAVNWSDWKIVAKPLIGEVD